jgi:uncharacterized membrane protein YeaQ/YmgE (transglycosylase-associated protein family)
MTENILWYLAIGVAAGWMAGKFVRGHGFGLWADLVMGMMGAVIGGFFLAIIGIHSYGIVANLIVSTIGAVVFLWLIRLFTAQSSRL